MNALLIKADFQTLRFADNLTAQDLSIPAVFHAEIGDSEAYDLYSTSTRTCLPPLFDFWVP